MDLKPSLPRHLNQKYNKRTKIRLSTLFVIALVLSLIMIVINVGLSIRTVSEWKESELSIHTDINSFDVKTTFNFVTIVLPSVVNPKGRANRLTSIQKTWGPSAHAIFVLHSTDEYIATTTDMATQSDDSFPQMLVLPPSITINDGAKRLKYVIQNIQSKYNPRYTFFVNDHTFVIPESICTFLRNIHHNEDEHLYAGHALKAKGKSYAFNSGASGYFLSRKTMMSLINVWNDDKDPTFSSSSNKHNNDCSMDDTSSWINGNPGLVIASCLRSAFNVNPVDTRDEYGRHIFHPYGFIRTVKGSFDGWFLDKHTTLHEILGEDLKYNHQPLNSKDCCSNQTISFHYVEYAETLTMYNTMKLLQKSYQDDATTTTTRSSTFKLSNDELKEYMISIWPKQFSELGGYAEGLPKSDDGELWDDILHVMRTITPNPRNVETIC